MLLYVFGKKKNLFSVISRRLIVEWALKKGNKLGLGEIGFFLKLLVRLRSLFVFITRKQKRYRISKRVSLFGLISYYF